MNTITVQFIKLAVDILVGGKDIPENLYNEEFIKAILSSGTISEDFINLLKEIDKSNNQAKNNNQDSDDEDENNKNKRKNWFSNFDASKR